MYVCIIYKIIKAGHLIANARVCMHTFPIYHFKTKVKENTSFFIPSLYAKYCIFYDITKPCIKKLSFITIVRMF